MNTPALAIANTRYIVVKYALRADLSGTATNYIIHMKMIGVIRRPIDRSID